MLSAVVLAAGKSTRMGKNKLLLKLEGREILLRTLDAVLTAGLDEVIVITGYDAPSVKKLLKALPVKVIHNQYYEEGQSTSVRVGIKAVNPSSEGVMFVPGDMPLLNSETLKKLISTFETNRNFCIIVPYFKGERGNPVIFHSALFPFMEKIKGDTGPRILFDQYKDKIIKVNVQDKGVVRDIDRPVDLLFARKELLAEQRIPLNYRGGLNRAQEIFAKKDPADMARRSGATFREDKFFIKYCTTVYSVSYPEGIVLSEDGKEAEIEERILLLLYLGEASGLPPEERWLSFKELPFGSHHDIPFQKEAEGLLEVTFGDNPQRLKKAAKKLGGKETINGHLSFIIHPLPKLPLKIIFWHGDEEFPPRAKILFNAVCTATFDTATLYMLGINIAKKLCQNNYSL